MRAAHRWWPGALAAGGAAAVAYTGAAYYSGELSYAPRRPADWVRARIAHTERVRALRADADWVPVDGLALPAPPAPARDGAVSPAMLSFRDRRDPRRTATFVHCGPQTCGFPFLVHGGVLGTLLYASVHLARGVPIAEHLGGTLSIRYRRPTLVDQVLCIETVPDERGMRASIVSARGHRLVEGVYTDPE